MKTKQEGASNTANGTEEAKPKTRASPRIRGTRTEEDTTDKKRRVDGNECRSRDIEQTRRGRMETMNLRGRVNYRDI